DDNNKDKNPFRKGRFPLVSSVIGLVSGIPRITIPRYLGLMPSWGWGETMKRRKTLRPVEKGLLSTILKAPVSIPLSPLIGVAKLARRVAAFAEEEMDQEINLKEALLELQMRREMGDITEDEYKEKAGELQRGLDELTEKEKRRSD
ncbi:MAG: gas vesicle protein GvpG, partial [Syntrophales bacterium]|nr:gas vesicle protein GvpG [Syntrophales bacterium]